MNGFVMLAVLAYYYLIIKGKSDERHEYCYKYKICGGKPIPYFVYADSVEEADEIVASGMLRTFGKEALEKLEIKFWRED